MLREPKKEASMAISHPTSMTPSREEAISTPGDGRTTTTHRGDAATITPIVIDLGKKRRKQIRALKRGSGKLMDEVAEVLNQVRGNLGPDVEMKNLVPVVMVYKQKDKKRGGLLPFSL
jgi:Family of unknown function (DUF6200)